MNRFFLFLSIFISNLSPFSLDFIGRSYYNIQ